MNSGGRYSNLLRIALAGMAHDWLATVCLVTALAAVICPVIVILGLKEGTVENLRCELLKDPGNLEIRPETSLNVTESLLHRIRMIEGVGFVVPRTRFLGSASVLLRNGQREVGVDFIPTAEGDPLLGKYGLVQPGTKDLVLTSPVAKSLALVAGDILEMNLGRRDVAGGSESVNLKLRVAGVMPGEATGVKAAFVGLPLLLAVEHYRENLAVPEFGWKGPESQRARPVYDGMLVAGPNQLGAELASRIAVSTGFLEYRRIVANDEDDMLSSLAAKEGEVMLFTSPGSPLPLESVTLAESILPGKSWRVLPWSKPREVWLSFYGTRVQVTLKCSLDKGRNSDNAGSKVPVLRPIAADDRNERQPATLSARSPIGIITFPCLMTSAGPVAESSTIIGYPALTGTLAHLSARSMTWDDRDGCFLLGRSGFSGLRIYARDLASVQPLERALENMGIPCISNAGKVAKVLRFEQNLTILFYLVGGFSVAGAGAALALSLYGAIERRKQDYAILRILGVSRTSMVLLPLIDSFAMILMALMVAMLGFMAIASVINRIYSSFSSSNGSSCFLTPETHAAVILCGMVLSILAAVAAGLRMLRLNPSQTIR